MKLEIGKKYWVILNKGDKPQQFQACEIWFGEVAFTVGAPARLAYYVDPEPIEFNEERYKQWEDTLQSFLEPKDDQ